MHNDVKGKNGRANRLGERKKCLINLLHFSSIPRLNPEGPAVEHSEDRSTKVMRGAVEW